MALYKMSNTVLKNDAIPYQIKRAGQFWVNAYKGRNSIHFGKPKIFRENLNIYRNPYMTIAYQLHIILKDPANATRPQAGQP
jgi:hypothetical protein